VISLALFEIFRGAASSRYLLFDPHSFFALNPTAEHRDIPFSLRSVSEELVACLQIPSDPSVQTYDRINRPSLPAEALRIRNAANPVAHACNPQTIPIVDGDRIGTYRNVRPHCR